VYTTKVIPSGTIASTHFWCWKDLLMRINKGFKPHYYKATSLTLTPGLFIKVFVVYLKIFSSSHYTGTDDIMINE
jgi:hypothetical protein